MLNPSHVSCWHVCKQTSNVVAFYFSSRDCFNKFVSGFVSGLCFCLLVCCILLPTYLIKKWGTLRHLWCSYCGHPPRGRSISAAMLDAMVSHKLCLLHQGQLLGLIWERMCVSVTCVCAHVCVHAQRDIESSRTLKVEKDLKNHPESWFPKILKLFLVC